MTDKEDILGYLKQEKQALFEKYRLLKLGLFGSFSRDEQTEESDIDLLIEFAPHTTEISEKKEQIRAVVGKRFNRTVDICREKFLKPYFRDQVLKSAIYV